MIGVIDELTIKMEKDKQFGKDFKKFNTVVKKIKDTIMDPKEYSIKIPKSVSLKYYNDTIVPQLSSLAGDYIELFDIKEVHVMPSGVIMMNKKMKGKK